MKKYICIIISITIQMFCIFSGATEHPQLEESIYKDFDKRFFQKDRIDFETTIKSKIITLDLWINNLNKNGYQFICLGESHLNEYRDFIANKILSQLKVNILAIEEDDEGTQLMWADSLAGKKVDHEGARIDHVLKAVNDRNPNADVIGVESTDAEDWTADKEVINLQRSRMNRDGFIAMHIDQILQQKNQYVLALYGAHHCSYNSDNFNLSIPFYRHIYNVSENKNRMHNVLIIPSKQKSSSFKRILDVLFQSWGLGKEIVVIPDTSQIKPEDHNYNWQLMRLFSNYKTIIYFPTTPKKFVLPQ